MSRASGIVTPCCKPFAASVPSRKNSLRVLPAIAEQFPKRAAQMNQSVSGLVAVLVWNYAQRPTPLESEKTPRDLARVNLPCSWRRGMRALVRELAAAARLSPNAFVEVLLANELRSPSETIVLLPQRGSTKPRL